MTKQKTNTYKDKHLDALLDLGKLWGMKPEVLKDVINQTYNIKKKKQNGGN